MATNPAAFLQKENTRLKTENEALHSEIYGLREFVKALNDIMSIGDIKSDTELMPLLRDILNKALKLLNTDRFHCYSAPFENKFAYIEKQGAQIVIICHITTPAAC